MAHTRINSSQIGKKKHRGNKLSTETSRSSRSDCAWVTFGRDECGDPRPTEVSSTKRIGSISDAVVSSTSHAMPAAQEQRRSSMSLTRNHSIAQYLSALLGGVQHTRNSDTKRRVETYRTVIARTTGAHAREVVAKAEPRT